MDLKGLFLDTTISIPLAQMVLFIFLLSVFLLFGKHRLCILTTFIFTFYWGFIFNRELFISKFGNVEVFMTLYLISGFLMVLMVLIAYYTGGD